MARLQVAEPGLWVLKGGMALEVRLTDVARLTKDIDVGLRDDVTGQADLHERLIDVLSDDPFNDRFIFEVSEPAALREDGGGHVTWRVPVAASLANKAFGAIKLDVSLGFPSNREGFPLCCGRLVCSESLVLDRRHQCGGAVSASGVVEVLAPGHHNLACLGFCGEVMPGQNLVFEGGEERLRSGVIET